MLKINIKFLSFMIIAFIFAYLQGGNLPYAIFYGFLITFFIGLYCIFRYRKSISAVVSSEQKIYSAGDKDVISNVIYNDSFIPMPYVLVKNKGMEKFDKDDAGYLFNIKLEENVTLKREICFNKRGIYNFGDISVKLKDIFGIFESSKELKKDYDIKVYPKIFNIETQILRGGDIFKNIFTNKRSIEDAHSTRDMRRYRDGDNLKKINWKVSAKYNELYVREFERVSGREFNLFLDMNKNIYEIDSTGELEQMLVDLAVSLVSYTMTNEIKSNVFINSNRNDHFQIQNKFDFEKLMEYFLNQFSDGELDFSNYLYGNVNKVSSLGGIGIITRNADDNLTKTLLKLKDSGYIITLFYLEKGASELKNINLLNKVGIECVEITEFINNNVTSEIG